MSKEVSKEEIMQKEDNVSHPYHYEGSTSLECIDTIRLIFGDIGACYFCLCNSYKYMWRYKNKNGKEDLDKAQWYVNYVTDLLALKGVDSPKVYELYKSVSSFLEEVKKRSRYYEKS